MVRAPPSVKIALSRVNFEVIVTGPPAHYIRSGKASMRTTTGNGPAKNTRAARAASGEHLMMMMELVARMKDKTYMYQRESLIELAY